MSGLGFIEGLAMGLAVNYKTFHISLILILCLEVFTTGVAQACWCQENCPCCKSQGLQYETEESEGHTCNSCCWAAGKIPCDLKKAPDMADSSTGDSRENGPDRAADFTVILADYIFDNHPFAYFAQTPCAKATTRPSVIYLQNQSFLL